MINLVSFSSYYVFIGLFEVDASRPAYIMITT